jgi:hypothetical protein
MEYAEDSAETPVLPLVNFVLQLLGGDVGHRRELPL